MAREKTSKFVSEVADIDKRIFFFCRVFASAKASELTLLESAKTLFIERRRIPLHAGLTA